MTWPISWPDTDFADALDPNIKALCELYAGACMTALTLHRVAKDPVTIMPGNSTHRIRGWYSLTVAIEDEYPLGTFYPGLVYPSAQDLHTTFTGTSVEALELPGPVGQILNVTIDGDVLDPGTYRVENGRYLIRLDGTNWPAQGTGFTVTYHNSHPAGALGAHAGGVMAVEWANLLTRAKGGCRLPKSVTSVSRQGISYEITPGMFPDGLTGIPEIDAYLMLWNPFGLKVAPRVYSPDLPRHRQVWGG